MSDLVTRLLLNSSQFDNTIQKSTKEVAQFQKLSGTITGTIGKFAGAIGLAGGAMEGFNQMMNNSQTFGDNMNIAITAAKDTVGEFFGALATGDFSSFLNGIDQMIAKSRDAAVALDQLGNTKISYGYFNAKYDNDMSDAILGAKNKQNDAATREANFRQWDAVLNQKQQAAASFYDASIDAVAKLAAKGTAIESSKIALKDVEKIVELDILPAEQRDAEKQRLIKGYEAYLKEVDDITAKWNIRQANTNSLAQMKENKEAKKWELASLADANKEFILYNNLLQKKNDEQLQQLTEIASAAMSTTKAIKDQRREYNESIVEFRNSQKNAANNGDSKPKVIIQKAKVPVEPVIPIGSIAELDKQLSDLRKQLFLEINPVSRANIYREITELESKKHIIEFQYKYPNKPTDNLTAKDGAGLNIKPTELPNKLPEYKPVISKKDVKTNEDYIQSLQAVGSMMGSITNMTSDGAAAWLSWGANLLGAVATAIPAIQTLTAAKKGEAMTNAVASATQTPVVGWLLAGAAVASVIAAFASMPKYATGGIVAGNSTIGDMNLARVNAGEMILNNRQQRNLFNLLNSNGTTSSNSNVTFKIQGKELVGVLNNYNTRINKVR